jgi:ankyrin repeat protein
MKCSNQFGESLLHLACRKSFADVVRFLVQEAGVPFNVKDDFGRNPAHDACWTIIPNWELMDLIVEKCPDLLFVEDVRGHTPLDYVRAEHWPAWVKYLEQKGDKLAPKELIPISQ